jgi:hypothetical protein
MNELHIVETGEVIEEMTRVEAERITSRIADKLDSIADDYEQVVPLIGEALTRNAWKSLGYASPTDYVSERFSGSLKRLPLEVRRPVVKELSEAGMSTRTIAPLVGRSREIVARDIRSGVNNVDTSSAPKSDAELLAGQPWTPPTEPETTTRWGLPKSDKIIGPDGKQYTRPEPKEQPKPKAEAITSQFSSAIVELNRILDKFHRISTNDNFNRNKSQIEALHGNDLARAISELQNLADQLN